MVGADGCGFVCGVEDRFEVKMLRRRRQRLSPLACGSKWLGQSGCSSVNSRLRPNAAGVVGTSETGRWKEGGRCREGLSTARRFTLTTEAVLWYDMGQRRRTILEPQRRRSMGNQASFLWVWGIGLGCRLFGKL